MTAWLKRQWLKLAILAGLLTAWAVSLWRAYREGRQDESTTHTPTYVEIAGRHAVDDARGELRDIEADPDPERRATRRREWVLEQIRQSREASSRARHR